VAIVLRANKESSELGGHIASFQSAATLYGRQLVRHSTSRPEEAATRRIAQADRQARPATPPPVTAQITEPCALNA
jgi:hypothetical protein